MKAPSSSPRLASSRRPTTIGGRRWCGTRRHYHPLPSHKRRAGACGAASAAAPWRAAPLPPPRRGDRGRRRRQRQDNRDTLGGQRLHRCARAGRRPTGRPRRPRRSAGWHHGWHAAATPPPLPIGRRSVFPPQGAATRAPRPGEPVGGGRGGVARRVDPRGGAGRRIRGRRLPACADACMGAGVREGRSVKGECRGLFLSALLTWWGAARTAAGCRHPQALAQ